MMMTTTYMSGSRRAERQLGAGDLIAKWVYAIFGLKHRPRFSAERLPERMRRDIGITRFNAHYRRGE